MSNRFLKFENTQLHKQFGEVLTVESELLTDTEYDYYRDTLTYLRTTFGCEDKSTFDCKDKPTLLQIDTYITNNEHFDEKYMDQNEFIILINRIFEKYITICKILYKLKIKKTIKNRSIAEREQQRKIKQELKEAEKKKTQAFNNAVIICECGNQYIRHTKFNHTTSFSHRDRLDAITWFKNNTSSVFDTDSVMSDITSLNSSVDI